MNEEKDVVTIMRSVEQIRIRHSLLVDKKLLEGLTEKELNELAQINRLLDAAEEKYYAPIKKALATVLYEFISGGGVTCACGTFVVLPDPPVPPNEADQEQ